MNPTRSEMSLTEKETKLFQGSNVIYGPFFHLCHFNHLPLFQNTYVLIQAN